MSIAEAVERANAYLAAHPEEARYRDSAARAHLERGLVVDVAGPTGESLRTDMPTGIGGTATAPSPGWFLRAAEAGCLASLIGIRAASLEVELRSVDVEVDSESDDRGILGLDESIPAGALSVRALVTIDAPGASRGTIEALAAWALDHCPVTDTVRRSVPIELEVR
ncbi:MAG TPA: OsmC family protein [Candidatus Limnocylindrales bacterium]|nr:OsmC family protein [Candidatus Limnocylindrales bacterium]